MGSHHHEISALLENKIKAFIIVYNWDRNIDPFHHLMVFLIQFGVPKFSKVSQNQHLNLINYFLIPHKLCYFHFYSNFKWEFDSYFAIFFNIYFLSIKVIYPIHD